MPTDTRTNDELSAEVARRLFGLEPHPTLSGWFLNASVGYKGDYSRPNYASDHNAALGLVVPEMRRRGYVWFDCGITENGKAYASFAKGILDGLSPDFEEVELPRAICEAALAALEAQG